MEPVGLFLGCTQAIAQLAGVVSRHASSYATLYPRASAVEAKARNACRVAIQLGVLTEIPGLTNDVISQKLEELHEVESKLSSIALRLSSSSTVGAFLRAPVLLRELNEIDSDLKHLDSFFRIIGILYSMYVSQRNDTRELAFTIASSCLSVSDNDDRQQQIYFELESRCGQLGSTHMFSSRMAQAEMYLAMGLEIFQPLVGGIVRSTFEKEKMQAASRYFRKACDLGQKEAHRYLGDVFYHGYGVECCLRTAFEIYQQGVKCGDLASKFMLSRCYAFGHGVEVEMDTAIRLRTSAADEGCAESMWTLGLYKLHGKHVESNHGEAFLLLQKAVRLGVNAAKGDLGLCYDRGIGVQQDSSTAFKLLREAFDAGSMFCIADLANCYNTGRGVAKNPEETAKLYEKCIKAGTWHADFYKALYGLHLVRGLGVAKNEPLGKAIILDATKTGNAIAWYALGECYRNGYGWDQEKGEARYFYEKAITCKNGIAGLVGSHEALGEMYETGEGGVACSERSSLHYLRAANMLSPKGQWKAALAFERGLGQTEDLHRAVHLFKMCANSGNESAQRKTMAYYMKGHGLERSRVHARKMMRDAAKDGNWKAKSWLIREDLRDALVHFRRLTV